MFELVDHFSERQAEVGVGAIVVKKTMSEAFLVFLQDCDIREVFLSKPDVGHSGEAFSSLTEMLRLRA